MPCPRSSPCFAASFGIGTLALAFLLTGCATRPAPLPIGRDFVQHAVSGLVLGETTPAQAEAVMGPPFRRQVLRFTAEGKQGGLAAGTQVSVAKLEYVYVLPKGSPGTQGHPTGKAAVLAFIDGTLAAYDVNSTIPGEANAPIDDSKLGLLRRGVTTRAEIIALFGPPNGERAPLAFARPGTQAASGAVNYNQLDFIGGDIRRRLLAIRLDAAGRMVSYAMVENTGPANAPLPMPSFPAAPREGPPLDRSPGFLLPRPAPGTTRS